VGNRTYQNQNSVETYYEYPVYDRRGTVVRLTDENGDVVCYGHDAAVSADAITWREL